MQKSPLHNWKSWEKAWFPRDDTTEFTSKCRGSSPASFPVAVEVSFEKRWEFVRCTALVWKAVNIPTPRPGAIAIFPSQRKIFPFQMIDNATYILSFDYEAIRFSSIVPNSFTRPSTCSFGDAAPLWEMLKYWRLLKVYPFHELLKYKENRSFLNQSSVADSVIR